MIPSISLKKVNLKYEDITCFKRNIC